MKYYKIRENDMEELKKELSEVRRNMTPLCLPVLKNGVSRGGDKRE